MRNIKQKIIRSVFIFIVGLILCTVISRTIYIYLLPVVTTTKVQNGSVEASYTTMGKIGIEEDVLKKEATIVYASIDGNIEVLLKEEGEKVKVGEVIGSIIKCTDDSDNDDTIEQMQLLQKQEELIYTQSKQDEQKKILQEQYLKCEQELENINQESSLVELDESIKQQEELIKVKESLYEVGGISKKEYDNAINELESLKRKRKDQQNIRIKEINNELKEIKEAVNELDEAIFKREQEYNLVKEKLQISNRQQERVDIISPISGYIYSLDVAKGKNVEKNEQLLIILPENIKYNLYFDVPLNMANRVEIGAQIDFSIGNNDMTAILSEKKDSPESGNVQFLYELNEEALNGLELNIKSTKTVSIELIVNSSEYEFIIDNSAIQTKYNDHYIYMIETSNGIGGRSYKVKQVKVDILEEGDIKSAIKGNIDKSIPIANSNITILKDDMEVSIEGEL